MNRDQFIKTGILGLCAMTWPSMGSGVVHANTTVHTGADPVPTPVIKEFVQAGHNDLARVKEMLSEIPNLLYTRYDWGGGDFEEAIEGAGHMGNKAVANYLIEKGARVNLFVLTMLGKTQLVKPVLEEYPNLIHAKGAHGFTLLHHAKVGGDDAVELYEYLSAQGLTETKVHIR